MSERWRWESWPLRTKLLLLTASISTLGILLVCTSLVVVENRTSEEQLESELHVIAGILAEQSAAALLFEDSQQLNTVISSLDQIETIEQVCVYNVAGEVMSAMNGAGYGPARAWMSNLLWGLWATTIACLSPSCWMAISLGGFT